MDLYTLTDQFLAKDVVDEYISAIWTERYSVAGDFQIVAAATPEMIEKLKEGTYLAMRGTNEVMIIDTISIENQQITAVGSTLLMYLNERMAWFKNPAGSAIDQRVIDYTSDDIPPGEFISTLVNLCVIDPLVFAGGWEEANLEWDLDVIPFLELGAIDTSGADKVLTIPIGPLYNSISQIAEKEGVGMSLYLESANAIDGYTLKFKTYRGVDHSTGGAGELVRLVPEMDSLSDVKELRSISNYKNVCYVYYKGIISVHYEDPLDIPEGMNRRVMVTNPNDEPVGHKEENRYWLRYGPTFYTVIDAADVAEFRAQNARDALANNNYIQTIDGQTSPNNDYQYGVHYGLGDTIELESITGTITKARVTEFIRSEDQEGEKQYPTIAVIPPIEEGG